MQEKTNLNRRPVSPHLGIYRLPLTALLSISHRLTGIVLILGFVFANLLLALAALNPERFDEWLALSCKTPPRFVLAIFLGCFTLHLVHGIRHLFWDFGVGFDRSIQHNAALIEILVWMVLTLTLLFIWGIR